MATRDYSDEDDYYCQGFEKEGIISIWLGLRGDEGDGDLDVLQDLCGVGYYRLDEQESFCDEYKLLDVEQLIKKLSFSESFFIKAITAAKSIGIEKARWIVAQYNFEYNKSNIKREISDDPIFLGSFSFSNTSA